MIGLSENTAEQLADFTQLYWPLLVFCPLIGVILASLLYVGGVGRITH